MDGRASNTTVWVTTVTSSPVKAKRMRLWSSSHTVIKPPVWHSTLPLSRQIETAEARSFSEFWNKSRQAFSSFLIGVENGVFHELKMVSLAAIFQNARLEGLNPMSRLNRILDYAWVSSTRNLTSRRGDLPETVLKKKKKKKLCCPSWLDMTSFQIDPSFTGYGKTGVRLLKIRRSGKYHGIKQIEVSTELKLNNYDDYFRGDNASIVPTDTQKNTVYALAKQHQASKFIHFTVQPFYVFRALSVTRTNSLVFGNGWFAIY